MIRISLALDYKRTNLFIHATNLVVLKQCSRDAMSSNLLTFLVDRPGNMFRRVVVSVVGQSLQHFYPVNFDRDDAYLLRVNVTG